MFYNCYCEYGNDHNNIHNNNNSNAKDENIKGKNHDINEKE